MSFDPVANAAHARLVVMTPFINSPGFNWLRSIFQTAKDVVRKIVVLREMNKYAVELGVHQAEWLRALQVSVFDYTLAHGADSGRTLPVETFHAKIVLADQRLAYVGSANMLGSGDGTSLEAGVLVDGRAAAQVARLVDGVLSVARKL